jgi:hypothetical protein
VLSTTTVASTACARRATAAMSVMRSSGLLGVSIHTTFGLRASAAVTAAWSVKSMKSTWYRPRSACALNRR